MARQRRPKGEGGISPIKDESGKIVGYEGSIEVKTDLGGKRKRRKVRGATKTEVSQKLRELQREQERGADLGSPRQTLEQYVAYWLENVVKHRSSLATYRNAERQTRLHVIPYIGHIRLDRLTQRHIEQMRDTLLTKPRAQDGQTMKLSSVKAILDILKRALNRAVRDGVLSRNVASHVELERPEFAVHALAIEQVEAFLEAVKGHLFEVLFVLLLLTGMRRGEGLALTRGDIDLEARTIDVNKSLSRIDGDSVLGKTKTRKPRTIAIPAVLIPLLERQLAHGYDLVFPNRHGGHVNPLNVLNQFKVIVRRAGLPRETTIHMLRHTFATFLLNAGENIANVAEQLGHARVSTTLNTYVDAVRASQAAGVDSLGDRLLGEKDD